MFHLTYNISYDKIIDVGKEGDFFMASKNTLSLIRSNIDNYVGERVYSELIKAEKR